MKDNNIISWVGSGITLATSALTQDIVQIILMILGVISSLVSLAYTIYKWWKKAKADGKIDEKEIEELGDIVEKHTHGGDDNVE